MANNRYNFVLSPSYHGATLLAVLLNNHDDIVSLGDAYPTEEFVQTCSCGEKVTKCSFWTGLRDRLSDKTGSHASYLPVLQRGLSVRAASMLGVLTSSVFSRPFLGDFDKRYGNFVDAVRELSGKPFFVDGQKSITKVIALRSLLDSKATIRIVHLARDPRGFLNSCKKYMDDATPATVAKIWNHHKWIALFSNPLLGCEYHLIRYEDLCREPARAMAKLFDFLDIPDQDVVRKPESHEGFHLMGNKMVKVFNGNVRLDTGWESGLSDQEQRQIMKMTASVRNKLGYVD